MEAEKRLSQVQENVVFVRILDPAGDSLQRWTIGEDVEPEIVDQWADRKTNTIYILNHYRNGEVEHYLASRGIWEKMKKAFDSV